MQTSKRTQILCVGAVMIALATVLSFLKIWEMPYGGSVTLFSMVPLVFISYKYGPKWGVFSAGAFSVVQMLFGIGAIGNDIATVIGSCVLDYILAYTVIGLSGMYRNRLKNATVSMVLGFLTATLIRYAVHVISGYIFFRSYAEWYFGQEGFTFGAMILEHISGTALGIFYAFFYNILFLAPDTVVAVIGLTVLSLATKEYLTPEQASN